MGRKIILWVLGYAWLALLVGLGLLGMAIYSTYSAGHGGGMPDVRDLGSISGTVLAGREMTVERKRRRGGKTTTQFFELDVKPDSGEIVKVRVDHAVPRERLEAAIDSKVTARYTPDDDNMVYELSSDQGVLVSLDDMTKIRVAQAERERDNLASSGMLGFDAALAAVGGLGVFWRRKLLAQPAA